MEEAGLFNDNDNFSEENFENDFKKQGLRIPGKKVFKILKKSLNKRKERRKLKKERRAAEAGGSPA